jgi:isochorismate hydrolase
VSPAEDGRRAALVVVDMQNYFFRTPERRARCDALVQSINSLASGCAPGRLFEVISVHAADRSTWSRNMLRRGGCLLEGSEEAAAVSGLRLPGALTVRKTRHSAFLRTDLEQRLRAAGVERIVLAGVHTHGCVALTAADAWSLDFEVAVAAEAVSSHRPELAAFCVERLRSMFEIPFLSNAELLRSWLVGPAPTAAG